MDKIHVMKKEDDMRSEDDFVADESRPLIPEDTYQVRCTRFEKGTYKGSDKMYVYFKIVSDGEYKGTELFMPMNQFKKVPIGSKYYEQWVIANGNILPLRHDRMSPAIFKDGYFEAVVRTVKPKFEDKTQKPECFHYSIVAYLKERIG
jgi:hypothetical protein